MLKKLILLSFLSLILTTGFSQVISLRFTTNYLCDYHNSDSILIENITQNCDTTLYWNDTVLNIYLSEIESVDINSENFVLQSFPNPFQDETRIVLNLNEKSLVKLVLVDVTGRIICSTEDILNTGTHNFTCNSGAPRSSILIVQVNDQVEKLNLIQLSASCSLPYIRYNGSELFSTLEVKNVKTQQFAFNIGDELKITSFVLGDNSYITDFPTENEDYNIIIHNSIPETPILSGCNPDLFEIEWKWFKDPYATGYKYAYADNPFYSIDLGTDTTLVIDDLFCEGELNLLLWSYNNCGNSDLISLSGSTLDCPEFSCGGVLYDTRDNSTYSTVQVGNQCWMQENLRYLPSVYDVESYEYYYSRYYVYGYDDTNLEEARLQDSYQEMGTLYNWHAAMNGSASSNTNPSTIQGACPLGWHLPSNLEWLQLMQHLNLNSEYWCEGDTLQISKSVSASNGWENSDVICTTGNDQSSNNITNFSALPTGNFSSIVGFSTTSNLTSRWWSTTDESLSANIYSLSYNSSEISQLLVSKLNGYSIRCVLDQIQAQNVVVLTSNATNISSTSVTCGGDISNTSSNEITSSGIVWSTYQMPTIDFNQGITNDGSVSGEFVSEITNLAAGTLYFVRAYAVNSDGIFYGNQISFETLPAGFGGTPCPGYESVAYHGYNYQTILIGSQCWFAENLRYLPSVSSVTDGSYTEPRYYVLNYDGTDVVAASSTNDYEEFGVLYNFEAAKTACPDGWYLPDHNAWTVLFRTTCTSETCETDFLFDDLQSGLSGTNEGSKLAGNALLWEDGSLKSDPAFGSSGFHCLPGGYRFYNGVFASSSHGNWWSLNDVEPEEVWAASKSISSNYTTVDVNSTRKDCGLSVRCVKADEMALVPTVSVSDTILVSSNRVILEGKVLDDGGMPVFQKGFIWDTLTTPTLESNLGNLDDIYTTETFYAVIRTLDQGTVYYFRPYAINGVGVGYGEVINFTTPNHPNCGLIQDARDNKSYNTFQIGNQCWMAENLAYLPAIHLVGNNSQTSARYYVMSNSSMNMMEVNELFNLKVYGALYNYPAAQTACPTGWKLAQHNDWSELEIGVCSGASCATSFPFNTTTTGWRGTNEGSKLAGGEFLWNSGTITSNSEFNTSGFNALPAGARLMFTSGYFGSLNTDAYFWVAPSSGTSKWYRRLYNSNANIYRGTSSTGDTGYSVRCIRDNTLTASTATVSILGVYSVTSSTALIKCNIPTDGGRNISSRGVVISTSPLPTLSNYEFLLENGVGAGSFNVSITGLSGATVYYCRAYATNAIGTSYSNEFVFTTSE